MVPRSEGQRQLIKKCVKLGRTAAETIKLLRHKYGENSLKKSAVYDWHRRYRGELNITEDGPCRGRPANYRKISLPW